MAEKLKTIYECQNCGAQYPKWSGRCLDCGQWGTLKSDIHDQKKIEKDMISKISSAEIINLSQIEDSKAVRWKSGLDEFDRVLGEGLVAGSLILLSGEPGVGKSTLVAQMAKLLVKNNEDLNDILYISGEESASQVKMRLERLEADLTKFKFIGETNLEKIISSILKLKPSLLIVDSIQTIYSATLSNEAGGISQIRAVTVKFMELAKKYNIPIFLIGHITKDGQVAGPKSLEHLVDVVLSLENDSQGAYAIIRSLKNRFGSVNEIGVLEMTAKGFLEVKDPSSSFLEADISASFPGSVFSCVIEGRRPFLINIQSLVSRTVFGYPQRKASGFDLNRVQVLTAVISKKQKIDLSNQDIILNVVGGFKSNDTALDLAVALAIISSFFNQELPQGLMVLGELGLSGEIRPISQMDLRLRELSKMGFKQVLMATSLKDQKRLKADFPNLDFIFLKNLNEALNKFFEK